MFSVKSTSDKKKLVFLLCLNAGLKVLLVRSSDVTGSGRQRGSLDLSVFTYFLKDKTPTGKPQPSSWLCVQLPLCPCVFFLESQLPSSVIHSAWLLLAPLGSSKDSDLMLYLRQVTLPKTDFNTFVPHPFPWPCSSTIKKLSPISLPLNLGRNVDYMEPTECGRYDVM